MSLSRFSRVVAMVSVLSEVLKTERLLLK